MEAKFYNHALKTLNYHIYYNDDYVILMISIGGSCLRKKIDFSDSLTSSIAKKLGIEIDDCIFEEKLIPNDSKNQLIQKIHDNKKLEVIRNLVQILKELKKFDYRKSSKNNSNKMFPLLSVPQLMMLTVKERQAIEKFGKSKNKTVKVLRQIYDAEPNLNKQYINFKYSKPLISLKLDFNEDSEYLTSKGNSPKKRSTTDYFDFKFNKEELGLKEKFPSSKMTFSEFPINEEIKKEKKGAALKIQNFSIKLQRFNRKKKILSQNPSNRNPQIGQYKSLINSQYNKNSCSNPNLDLLPINNILAPQLKKYLNVCTTKDQKFQKYKSSEFIFKNRQVTKRTQLQKIKFYKKLELMNKLKNEDIKLLTSKLKLQQVKSVSNFTEKAQISHQKSKEKNKGNYWDGTIIWNGYEAIKRSSLYKTKY